MASEYHAKDPITTAGIHAKQSIKRAKPTHKHSVCFSGLPPEAGQLIFTNNLLLELEWTPVGSFIVCKHEKNGVLTMDETFTEWNDGFT